MTVKLQKLQLHQDCLNTLHDFQKWPGDVKWCQTWVLPLIEFYNDVQGDLANDSPCGLPIEVQTELTCPSKIYNSVRFLEGTQVIHLFFPFKHSSFSYRASQDNIMVNKFILYLSNQFIKPFQLHSGQMVKVVTMRRTRSKQPSGIDPALIILPNVWGQYLTTLQRAL